MVFNYQNRGNYTFSLEREAALPKDDEMTAVIFSRRL
jgi:hypothetical protein